MIEPLLIILQIVPRSYYGRIYDYKSQILNLELRKDRRIHQSSDEQQRTFQIIELY
jgi:hypothetical protein